MTSPILSDQDLATLLKVPGKTVEALIARTSMPRFFIDGKMRFATARVLAWIENHEGAELLPPLELEPVAVVAAEDRPPPPQLPAAGTGEHPWIEAEALDALADGASDPARNLDRLKLRDALLELNDALLGVLSRFSGGRLHPHHDEKSRTSPWRLDLGSDERIDAISIAWGAGEHAPPDFEDRPHVAVELAKGELRVALVTVARAFTPPLEQALLDALADKGIAIELGLDQRIKRLAKVYALPAPAPSVGAIVHALEGDLEALVALWARLV
jgi:hypothetical protein